MSDVIRGSAREWLVLTAAAGGRVGIVSRDGLLVNAGVLSESNDRRKVIFSTQQFSGVCDVWLDQAGQPDEYGYSVVPMTPEHEARWELIQACREVPWAVVGSDVLLDVLRLLKLR